MTRSIPLTAPSAPKLAAALASALLLWSAPPAVQAQYTLCPGSPSTTGGPAAARARAQPEATPLQLLPGTTRTTTGTNLVETPRLQGTVLVTESIPFSFIATAGTVQGTVIQTLVNADDGTCDCYWTVRVHPASAAGIDRLTLTNVVHPATLLYGDYRKDALPLGVPSTSVRRSVGTGSSVVFRIPAGVQPGQTSRRLFLDSDLGAADKSAQLTLRAVGGGVSPVIEACTPKQP